MANDDFELWMPPARPSERPASEADEGSVLQWALQHITLMRRDEARSVIDHLIRLEQFYQAARCLEVAAQHGLGIFFTGDELTDRRDPGFGDFHQDIRNLLEAGALYYRSRRRGTALATFQRALIFVEEALRGIGSFEVADPGDGCCIGLGFELAGHCASAVGNHTGIEYYKAAEEYWGHSAQIDLSEVVTWQEHPVTQTVISTLEPILEVKPVEPALRESLFVPDYQTRLGTAKGLLC